MFKRVFVLLATVALAALGLVTFGSAAQAAPSSQSNSLTCFDGASEGVGNGVCTRHGGAFTLSNPAPGDYSGVYVENQNLAGQSVRALGLTYTYAGTTGGGSPRFSIPLVGGGYAYVDATCDANADGIVSLQEPGCVIADSNGYYGPASAYTGVVASGYTFLVADQPGTVTVSNINLGRTPPGKAKS